jgi:ketosteroid isomerase-like protein
MRMQAEAFNNGDLEAYTATLAENVEWAIAREHPAARTLHGREEVRSYLEDWRESLGDMSFELDEIIEGDASVLTLGRIRGTGAGSGAEVVVPLGYLGHVRNGIVYRVEEFLDPEEARRAVAG